MGNAADVRVFLDSYEPERNARTGDWMSGGSPMRAGAFLQTRKSPGQNDAITALPVINVALEQPSMDPVDAEELRLQREEDERLLRDIQETQERNQRAMAALVAGSRARVEK